MAGAAGPDPGDADVAGVSDGGEGGGLRVLLAALVGFLVIGTSILLVLAATTHALGEIDRDRPRSTYDAPTGWRWPAGGRCSVPSWSRRRWSGSSA